MISNPSRRDLRRRLRLAVLPLVALLAACSGTVSEPAFGVSLSTNFKIGREADDRDGIDRQGSICIRSNGGDRGGNTLSRSC
ncbi:MAG: hypothetical protein AAF577_07295 [Pseudomonadota bacterium]